MQDSNCDSVRGWTRLGYLRMTEVGATCPSGLTVKQFSNISYNLCSWIVSSSGSQASVFFTSYGVSFKKYMDK